MHDAKGCSTTDKTHRHVSSLVRTTVRRNISLARLTSFLEMSPKGRSFDLLLFPLHIETKFT